VIVEPGDSAIEPDGDGRVVRVVTTRVVDAARESVNADAYREHPDAVTPLGPPVIGPGTRVHALADHPAGEGEIARLPLRRPDDQRLRAADPPA